MKLSDLQFNTIDQLFSVLDCLGDAQEQRRYKNAVPFVHIPEELFNQWETYPRLAQEEMEWFMQIFSEQQVERMLVFNQEVVAFWEARAGHPADVPEILNDELWLSLGRKALQLKEALIQDQPLFWEEYHKSKQSQS